MSNIIDSIQLSGVTYTIQGSGGGKTIEAGRGISVTTGETADTVSFNLPISAGTGSNSIAEGNYTQATGGQSHAEGDGTIANGISSHAEGASTTASGICSHAEGYYTQARGNNSHAEGNNAQARGNNSHAEGCGTMAAGNYSHAEGYQTFVSSNYSHAEGYNTTVNGNYSHAEGNYTIAINQSEHASGQYNVSNNASATFGNSGNTLFSVGNGTADNARHNAFEIRQNGDIYITSGGTDIKLQDNLGGGNPTVELTQAQYDALVSGGTVDPTAFYIITDAQAGDLTQYWTSAQTNSAITQATSGKVDTSTYNTYTAATDTALANKQTTLTAGTGIDITDNVISATGGGGKAVSGGTNISITTGETADTINCTLPLEQVGSTNNYSISLGGFSNTNRGIYCYFGGHDNVINNYGSKHYIIGDNNQIGLSTSEPNLYNTLTVGEYNINRGGVVFGRYNSSSNTTLFSVGNGTADNARHNAFEVRQNGDIYCSDGTNDVKLQDTITATAANTTALGGLSLVKLTQSEYDALAIKDNSTLYVIVN